MTFARWVIRASNVALGLTAALMLVAAAVEGYWLVFFPFLLVVAVWLWALRRWPQDFR